MCLCEQADIPGVQVDWLGWFWECMVYCTQYPKQYTGCGGNPHSLLLAQQR